MEIPEQLIVEEGAYASDGGSTYLRLRDGAGGRHDVVLWQHMFTDDPDPNRLPGRLYYDGALVAVRSDEERRLIQALHAAPLDAPETPGGPKEPRGPGMVVGQDLQDYQAAIDAGPAAALAFLVRAVLEWVESEAYVELARRLGEG